MSEDKVKKATKKKTKATGKSEPKAKAYMYDVVRSPVITEKSQSGVEANKITFNVSVGASKAEIKKAVENIFGVAVVKVNTLNRQGKEKFFRGAKGKRNDTKKAIVTVAEGQTIDLATTV